MKARARAKQFFQTYRPPDAQWYVDEVLVVGLADALRAHANEALERAAKYCDDTADLASEATDHKAEGILRGIAANLRALKE